MNYFESFFLFLELRKIGFGVGFRFGRGGRGVRRFVFLNWSFRMLEFSWGRDGFCGRMLDWVILRGFFFSRVFGEVR